METITDRYNDLKNKVIDVILNRLDSSKSYIKSYLTVSSVSSEDISLMLEYDGTVTTIDISGWCNDLSIRSSMVYPISTSSVLDRDTTSVISAIVTSDLVRGELVKIMNEYDGL